MKYIMNLSTCEEDLSRFESRTDLEGFYRTYGLDGLEILQAGNDHPDFLRPENVLGAHLRYDSAWMDFWQGDTARLCQEFGDLDTAYSCYGGCDRAALVKKYQHNLDFFAPYQPEYLVFHVSDCTMQESMRRIFHYTDFQVIDAAAQLVNQLHISGTPWLLFENLWYPGLNLQNPDTVTRLLEQVTYPKTGVMLDLGHLLHTNPALRTDDEAVDYIHSILDHYSDLSFIRGIHLHQSLSGEYAQQCMQTWQPISGTYQQRLWEVLGHIFAIDTHRPFRSPRIWEILDRIQPEYLVWEQISADRQSHAQMLAQQQAVLTKRKP